MAAKLQRRAIEQFRKAARQVVENDINPHVTSGSDAKDLPANIAVFSTVGADRCTGFPLSRTRSSAAGKRRPQLHAGTGEELGRLRRCSYG